MESLYPRRIDNLPPVAYSKSHKGIGIQNLHNSSSHHNQPLKLTPELEKDFEEAFRAYNNGECITCHSIEELHKLLDSL